MSPRSGSPSAPDSPARRSFARICEARTASRTWSLLGCWPTTSSLITMQREPLRDGHGRLIGDLRVSVTDRCNFRCQYCMPAEGLPWLNREEILSFEEIARIVELLSAMGVQDVRLTGGEPLVRRNFPQLAAMLASLPNV